jgi:hypothetical protein
LRSVYAVQPILAAIDVIVAHSDECSDCCSSTSRTARSRTSGEYLLFLFMTPSSQEMESPEMPGRFKFLDPGKPKRNPLACALLDLVA